LFQATQVTFLNSQVCSPTGFLGFRKNFNNRMLPIAKQHRFTPASLGKFLPLILAYSDLALALQQ
jgi:hypothetical protein